MIPLQDWWLPAEISESDVFSSAPVQVGALLQARPTPEGLKHLQAHLHHIQAQVLAHRSIESILTSLDRLARLWLDPALPERRLAIAAIADVTGFSPEQVAHSIDLEMRSSLEADLRRALTRELGNPAVLDGFAPVPGLEGRSFAQGPGLIGAIFSANIPALPHLTVMRALLVKAACLGRVSRDEPLFLPLYARTLEQVDPELARGLAVVRWEHTDQAVETAFLSGIDHLIFYGGEAAAASLQARCPPGLASTWHGHRVSFGVVLRSALESPEAVKPLARALAYDFTVFEQHACLSPQALYVETGGQVSPETLAEALVEGLEHWAERLPPRRLAVAELGQRRGLLAELNLRALMGEAVRVVSPPHRLQGVVTLEPAEPVQPSPLDRWVRVMPIDGWKHLNTWMLKYRKVLQNVAVAGNGSDAEMLRLHLARWGVTRVCTPGTMATPTMMWHHDGQPRLGELVRWCDEETRQWASVDAPG